ncbi:MAG: tryptophan synthase subunit alpha [Myxococcota bacterium]|nr:tryptophan synthase subunit alpha [Myxococcota bacterium]
MSPSPAAVRPLSSPPPDRIAAAFSRCRAEKRSALITYVMAHDPDFEGSLAIARACLEGGADLLELGSPFSDPVADGPVIQRAGERALASGGTLAATLKLASLLRADWQTPIAVMTYANPVYSQGERRFAQACRRAGVDAALIPDLPPEESVTLRAACAAEGVCVPSFLTPVSTPDRRAAACAAATGFLYFVTVTGVTGARRALPSDLGPLIAQAREQSPVPVVIGFGVSEPAQARKLSRIAEGVVVGSAIVARAAESGSLKARARRVRDFVRSLREALEP